MVLGSSGAGEGDKLLSPLSKQQKSFKILLLTEEPGADASNQGGSLTTKSDSNVRC